MIDIYKCMICGKEHTSIDKYAACVANCNRIVKAEQEKRREEKLAEEKADRLALVNKKYNEFQDELKSFAKDYGYVPISLRNPLSDLYFSLF